MCIATMPLQVKGIFYITWNVPEGTTDSLVFIVDDKWALALDKTSVSHLPLARTNLLGGLAFLHIRVGVQSFEHLDSIFGLGNLLNGVIHYQRDFPYVVDAMASGHDEGREGGGCQSRAHGITTLVLVDPTVPPAPGLGGSKHTATTAHLGFQVKGQI